MLWALHLTSSSAIGLGMKLEDNVALCFDGLAINCRGLIAPFVEGFGDRGDQIRRTEDLFYVFDVAVGGDGGFDADGISGDGWNSGGLRIDAGNKLADNYPFIAAGEPSPTRRGHENGTVNAHGDSRRFENAFAGQREKGSLTRAG